jgi:hypothetical protein
MLLAVSSALLLVIRSAFRNYFRILAGQASLVDDLSFSASDKSRVSIDTGDESSTVSWQSESRVRPELVGECSGLNLIRASVSNNLLGIALVKKKVRPVAGVGFVVISKSRLAWGFIWHTVGTLDIRSMASWSLGVETELVKASWGGNGRNVS